MQRRDCYPVTDITMMLLWDSPSYCAAVNRCFSLEMEAAVVPAAGRSDAGPVRPPVLRRHQPQEVEGEHWPGPVRAGETDCVTACPHHHLLCRRLTPAWPSSAARSASSTCSTSAPRGEFTTWPPTRRRTWPPGWTSCAGSAVSTTTLTSQQVRIVGDFLSL